MADPVPPPKWMLDDFAAVAAGVPDRAFAYLLWPHVADALANQDQATHVALRSAITRGEWALRYDVDDDDLVEWITVVVAGLDLARVDTRRLVPAPWPA